MLVSSHLITELALSCRSPRRDRSRPRCWQTLPSRSWLAAGGATLEEAYLALTSGMADFTRGRPSGAPDEHGASLPIGALKLRSLPSTYVVDRRRPSVSGSASAHWRWRRPHTTGCSSARRTARPSTPSPTRSRASSSPSSPSEPSASWSSRAEYASGTMQPTLVASPGACRCTPRRWPRWSWSCCRSASPRRSLAFVLGQRAVAARHLDVALSDPHVLRAVVGAGAVHGGRDPCRVRPRRPHQAHRRSAHRHVRAGVPRVAARRERSRASATSRTAGSSSMPPTHS